jgi:hypothetical protein
MTRSNLPERTKDGTHANSRIKAWPRNLSFFFSHSKWRPDLKVNAPRVSGRAIQKRLSKLLDERKEELDWPGRAAENIMLFVLFPPPTPCLLYFCSLQIGPVNHYALLQWAAVRQCASKVCHFLALHIVHRPYTAILTHLMLLLACLFDTNPNVSRAPSPIQVFDYAHHGSLNLWQILFVILTTAGSLITRSIPTARPTG